MGDGVQLYICSLDQKLEDNLPIGRGNSLPRSMVPGAAWEFSDGILSNMAPLYECHVRILW